MRYLPLVFLAFGCGVAAKPAAPSLPPLQPTTPVVKKCQCKDATCKDGDGCVCKDKSCTCKKPEKKNHYVEARRKAIAKDRPLIICVGCKCGDWHWADHLEMPLGWWGNSDPCCLICLPKDGDLWCHKTISCDLGTCPTANEVWRIIWEIKNPEPVAAPPMPIMQNFGGGRRGGGC